MLLLLLLFSRIMLQTGQSVSQKCTPLRLLHIFQAVAILRKWQFTQLFPIHIFTYVPILVHLS